MIADVIAQNSHLAKRAASLAPAHLREDAEAAAMVGLWQAAQSFDESKGGLKEHLLARARGAVADFLRGWDHLSRDHRKEVKAGSCDDVCLVSSNGGHDGVSVMAALAVEPEAERSAIMASDLEAVDLLPIRMRAIVAACLSGETLADIGALLGVTESRVCQIVHEAEAWIRDAQALTKRARNIYRGRFRLKLLRRRGRRSCLTCGKQVGLSERMGKVWFCSDACRIKRRRQKARGYYLDRLIGDSSVTCSHCGRPAKRNGLCWAHEKRLRLGMPMNVEIRPRGRAA